MGFKPVDPNSTMHLDSIPLGYAADPSMPASGEQPPAFGGFALDELGISMGQRLMRGWISDDAKYQHYLQSSGLEVEPIPGYKGVFRVRKDSSKPWKVTDRANMGSVSEMIYDIADHAKELLVGGGMALGAAALGGPGAAGFGMSIVGSGLGAGTGELVGQNIGLLSGEDTTDPMAVAERTAEGAVGEFGFGGAGRLVGKLGSTVGAETLAGFGGIKNLPGIPRRQVLIELAEEPAGAFYRNLGRAKKSYRDAIEPIRAYLAKIKDEGVLDETLAIREMLKKADADPAVRVSLGEVRDLMLSRENVYTSKQFGKIAASDEAALLNNAQRSKMTKLRADIETNILLRHNDSWTSMKPSTADLVRQKLREESLAMRSPSTTSDGRLVQSHNKLSNAVSQGMGVAAKNVDAVMGAVERGEDAYLFKRLRFDQKRKLDSIDVLRDNFGTDEQSMEAAAKWLYNSSTRESAQISIADAARELGIDIKWIRRANLQHAAAGDPRFDVSGFQIGSPSLRGGVAGDSPTGLMALFHATSPKGAIVAARMGMQLAEFARRTAPFGRGLYGMAISNVDLTPGTPGVAEEDAPLENGRVADLTSGY